MADSAVEILDPTPGRTTAQSESADVLRLRTLSSASTASAGSPQIVTKHSTDFELSPKKSPPKSPQLAPRTPKLSAQNRKASQEEGNIFTRERGSTLPSVSIDDKCGWCLKCFPAEVALCGGYHLRRKTYCRACSWTIICGLLIGYLVYQLILYFDPDLNKIESIDIRGKDQFPYPYVYLHWELPILESGAAGVNCSLLVISDSVYQSDRVQIVSATDDNVAMSDLLGAHESDWLVWFANASGAIELKSETNDAFHASLLKESGELLLVPPAQEYARLRAGYSDEGTRALKESFSDSLQLNFYCDELESADDASLNGSETDPTDLGTEELSVYSSILYYDMGTRESLHSDETLHNEMIALFTRSEFMLGGYIALLEYDWYDYENKVEGSKGYNTDEAYFVSYISGVYDIVQHALHYEGYNWEDAFWMVIRPDHSAKKVVFQTDPKMHFSDVISNIGGFYTSIAGIIAAVFFAIIWGFDLKIIIFSGLDGDAEVPMSRKEVKMIEKFVKDYYDYRIEKDQKSKANKTE